MRKPNPGQTETILSKLRALYDSYGYTHYKMSKFEEYDLYAHNKDFLISDSVITFTDTNGKLMALKPDVTLSIIKNARDDAAGMRKLYYNENVYRVSGGQRTFREMMQVGLECMGRLDGYTLCEVVTLAARSLMEISENSILALSDLNLLTDVLDNIGLPGDRRAEVIRCIGQKNRHELTTICRECQVAEENIEKLCALIALSGPAAQVLGQVKALGRGLMDEKALDAFADVVLAAAVSPVGGILHIDFSVVDDVHYYNGIVFKGFVHGVPSYVLSGGRYDRLIERMHKSFGAIGFAVYMDDLERLNARRDDWDVDVALLYDADTPIAAVQAQVQQLVNQGYSVLAQHSVPEGVKCRQCARLIDGEVHWQ